MRRRRTITLAALGLSGALALAACTTSGTTTTGGGTPTSSPGASGFNAAVSSVVNPSTTKTSGTINFGNSSAPDSTDPANTYYAYMWNFVRLYTMPLMTYKSCPGQCGLQVVPSLATGPGEVSDNGLTWTYHIQPGVKFEDGTTVTSKDVKYAVERTFDRGLFPLGPNYFSGLLAGNAAKYPGPYKDKAADKIGLTSVTTPNTPRSCSISRSRSRTSTTWPRSRRPPRCRRPRTPARTTSCTRSRRGRTSSPATS